TKSDRLQIEWVGERRDAKDGTAFNGAQISAVGKSDSFDVVVLTVGFGVERDTTQSYWRNETIGQPSLDQPRRAYLVSGQGDGAMIDLLRLRISEFRQDRILDQLFRGKARLVSALKILNEKYGKKIRTSGLFNALEALEEDATCSAEFEQVCEGLTRRL